MIVVSDTSPVSNLLTLGLEGLLNDMFQEVIVPQSVHDELIVHHPQLPPYLRVEHARDMTAVARLLSELDLGEMEGRIVELAPILDRLERDARFWISDDLRRRILRNVEDI